jgi:hypothetical protein
MAGTPVKRERFERAQANGEITTPQRISADDLAAASQPEPEPEKKKAHSRGASPERMRELVEIRRKYAREGHPEKMGGRPRTKRTRREAEEDALARMVPRALNSSRTTSSRTRNSSTSGRSATSWKRRRSSSTARSGPARPRPRRS